MHILHLLQWYLHHSGVCRIMCAFLPWGLEQPFHLRISHQSHQTSEEKSSVEGQEEKAKTWSVIWTGSI